MAQYIDKAALVAEIENLLDKGKYYDDYDCAFRDGNNSVLYALKGKINTLEVKEVDLSNSFDATVCKIGSTYLKEMDRDAIAKALEPYKDGDKVKVIIEAQKGE